MDGKKKREREKERQKKREKERESATCVSKKFAHSSFLREFARERCSSVNEYRGISISSEKTRQTAGNAIDSRSRGGLLLSRNPNFNVGKILFTTSFSVNRILDKGTLKFDNYSRIAEKLTFSSAGATAVRRETVERLCPVFGIIKWVGTYFKQTDFTTTLATNTTTLNLPPPNRAV